MDKMMKTRFKQEPNQLNRSPASIQKDKQPTAPGLVDNRNATALQRQLIEGIDNGPVMTLQRQQLEHSFGLPVQKVTEEEEELLQGKFETVQRQEGLEEEELLQGKFEAVQRQPEEEELLQGKFETVQLVQENPIADEQAELSELINDSPRSVAQRRMIETAFGNTIQKFGDEEEEPFQQNTNTGSNEISNMPSNETDMPDQLKSGVESLSGMDMSDVRVHYNSSKPAQINALAYAQGTDIHLGSGQEKHLPHEAWHVVQQKQGRVNPTLQMKGEVCINNDVGLEKEADVMGAKAATQHVSSPIDSDSVESGIAVQSKPCVQALLGFELEWLTFVDIKGHRVPEKTKLGTYGNHLTLDVDESNVGTLPEPAPENIESHWSDGDGKYLFYNPLTGNSTWDDPGGDHVPYPSIMEIVTKPYAPETQGGRANLLASMEEAKTLADAIHDGTGRQPMNQVPNLTPTSKHLNVGHDTWGSTDASIQTTFGVDLAQLGSLIDSLSAEKSMRSKFRMKHHSDTEGALKADDETLTAMGETDLIGKGQEEMPNRELGDRVEAELSKSVTNARAIINTLVDQLAATNKIEDNRKAYWKANLHNLEGLLICVCQYLQMGNYFYYPDVIEDERLPDMGKMKKHATGGTVWRKVLDKNVVAMMARTDMAKMYKALVPENEKKMDCLATDVNTVLMSLLLTNTNRTADKALFNDPTESMGKGDTDFGWMVTCGEFVSNVFTVGSDGVTPNFGAIQEMGPEKVDPSAWKKHNYTGKTYYGHPTEKSQWNKPDEYKEGAVFELRNLIPRLGGGRFPKSEWVRLAEHITKCLAMLNARDESVQGGVNPKWAGKDETWEDAL